MILVRIIFLVLLAVGLLVAWIYFRQDKMIYYQRVYRPDHLALVPPQAVKLEYKISCGSQTAYYVPPRSATDARSVPPRLWMLFGGNGSLALFWAEIVAAAPDDEAGYILFDYPGYGHCQGKPSLETIAESGDAVIGALADYLDTSQEKLLATDVRLLGHSLGTGMALAFARRHHVDRVVLVAPFTTFRAMADRVVTPLLGWLLKQNMDNIAGLNALAAQNPQPRVIVTHGDADDIVPVQMSRELKQKFPELVDYIEVYGAGHEDILHGVEAYMAAELPDALTSLQQARQAADPIDKQTGAGARGPADNSR